MLQKKSQAGGKKSRSAGRRRATREELVLAGLEALLAGDAADRESADGRSQQNPPGMFPRVNSSSPYQVVVTHCEQCGESRVRAGSGTKPLSPVTFARIACDAKILEPGARNRSTIAPATRRAVLARDGHRCRMKGCESTRFLEVHHHVPRSAGGGNASENLITLRSACHQLLHERPWTDSSFGEKGEKGQEGAIQHAALE